MSQSFLGSTFNQEKCEPHVDYRNKEKPLFNNHCMKIHFSFPFHPPKFPYTLSTVLQNFGFFSWLIVSTCIYLYICTYVFLYITCSVHIILLFVCFLGWLFSPGKPSSVAFPPPAFFSCLPSFPRLSWVLCVKVRFCEFYSYLVCHVWRHQPSSAHI